MKLYVGNLSYETRDEDLEQIFSPHGAVVSARVVVDRATNRSRGFGFVEMDSAASGSKAIAALDGKDVQGRSLRVNEAKPRETRESRPSRY